MRIVTWNINGIRTLPQYYPWCAYKTFDGILNHLQADIICFQEIKASRSALSKNVAIPDSYHSFFSFPTHKTGYSGVSVYTRADSVIPIKAEEGLSGLLQPKPPLSDSELVSNRNVYPPSLEEGPGVILNSDLDSEGRALTIDFGLFVLINVYCPNDGTGTEERDKFKMDFHRMLELRVKGLVKEGREVVVVGDINACAAVIDHCEGSLMVTRGQAAGMKGEEGFWEKESRRWFRDWLVREDEVEGTIGCGGCMVDVVRRFWPDRKGMYTCWNVKLSARESNYGTRIDYILITKGLIPWIKAADVQQDVRGSDHCPVFVDFHDEVTNSDGSVTRLRDVVGAQTGETLPRLAAKCWDEYSGKQTQLHKFFAKKSFKANATDRSVPDEVSQSPVLEGDVTTLESSQSTVASLDSLPHLNDIPPVQTTSFSLSLVSPASQLSPILTTASPVPVISAPRNSRTPSSSSTDKPQKRKLPAETPLERIKKQRGKRAQSKVESTGTASQTTLSSFFSKPKNAAEGESPTPGTGESIPCSSACIVAKGKDKEVFYPMDIIDVDGCSNEVASTNDNIEIERSTHLVPSRLKNGNSSINNGRSTWSTILAPTPIPRCTVHDEPAKEYTVNKPGPNKGKRFFICSRPVGPGYDKGRAERPREEVDPQYRCNFFKWSSDLRKEMKRLGS